MLSARSTGKTTGAAATCDCRTTYSQSLFTLLKIFFSYRILNDPVLGQSPRVCASNILALHVPYVASNGLSCTSIYPEENMHRASGKEPPNGCASIKTYREPTTLGQGCRAQGHVLGLNFRRILREKMWWRRLGTESGLVNVGCGTSCFFFLVYFLPPWCHCFFIPFFLHGIIICEGRI